jgi:hypothetical protein
VNRNGNGRASCPPVVEPAEPDELKVSLLTTALTAAMWYEQDRTDKAYRVLVESIRDCLQQLLGREPAGDEIDRVLRREL